jgi:hypothetical protein
MVGAINIAPLSETVEIRGHKLTVRGLEAEVIIGLLANFDEFRKMWDTRKFDMDAFVRLNKPAAAYVIAGCVDGLDEENALNLSLGERAEILSRVIRLSSDKGVHPFVSLMEALGLGDPSSAAPAMKSSPRSKNSSRTDTPTPGDIHAAS